ncbi:Hypothetical_protein [Hexamita inflata]|uniref:Hypothetical_protein n=1 Tax=Hexamita inflata TaxID=28002 RepID=A0AA86NJW4_9EUKA|nr:Hypothetical protein HINF_LOCUS6491 [Hexamita inflata]CAI9920326.1 Hypothetical protein HINF_LOCUS7971 [Hexamita inflata]
MRRAMICVFAPTTPASRLRTAVFNIYGAGFKIEHHTAVQYLTHQLLNQIQQIQKLQKYAASISRFNVSNQYHSLQPKRIFYRTVRSWPLLKYFLCSESCASSRSQAIFI